MLSAKIIFVIIAAASVLLVLPGLELNNEKVEQVKQKFMDLACDQPLDQKGNYSSF